jgi:D-3-phosphoglycerate dehydrogenase
MLDVRAYPGVLEPLSRVADITELPASQQELLKRIAGFDAFLTPLTVRTGRHVLQQAPQLLAVATPSTGTDHIDVACARERGVEVISLKCDTEFLRGVTATAELAWALVLAVVRRLPWAFEAARSGDWARDKFRGRQLSGKTLGILGYGRLGRIVGEYGQAFGMRVLACDIRDLTPEPGIEMVSFDRLLKEADALTIHIHLTEETRGLMNAQALRQMKPGSVLINTSRGAILDEQALLAALQDGQLSAAGLDVIDGEWMDDMYSHPLLAYAREHANLVITPHIGGVTWESQSMTFRRCAGKLAEFLEGRRED